MILDAGGDRRGVEGPRRKRPPWRALTVATALHLLFALSIFASASGVISGGMPDARYGDAIELSLSGLEGAPATSVAASAPGELETLFERIRATQSDLNAQAERATTRSDLSALFGEIEQAHAAASSDANGAAGRDATGRAGAGSSRAGAEAQGDDDQKASRSGERSRDLSSGDLWGQIEPCWRRMPESSAVPVTLEVTLNDRGALAKPPTIIRPMAAALNDKRLIAEARAVAAVAACAPLRVSLTDSARTFRVVFMPTSEVKR